MISVKNRLIFIKKSKNGYKYRLLSKSHINTLSNKTLYISKGFIIAIAFFSIVISLNTANAGIFSFINDLINRNEEKGVIVDGKVMTSQNMPVLQAPANFELKSASNDDDLATINNTSLLPEVGPSGTLADIDEYASTQISLYVVRKGDSLAGIAKMYGVSVNTIVWANSLDGAIKEGQKLVILPISGVSHIVKKGDTIDSIAKKYRADSKEIIQFNNISKLAIGDTIVIPDGEVAGVIYNGSEQRSVRGYSSTSYDNYYIRPLASGRKTQGLHGYNGIDIGAPIGTPILASASGSVIIAKGAGYNGGYGEYVVISHSNGTQTLYGHMSLVNVYAGQYVSQGDIIGYVGNTGRSTGPHLHFEIRGAKNPF